MPIYDYRCSNCDLEFEELSTIANRKYASCPECAYPAKLLVSAPAGINANNGEGYKSKGGSTGVWQSDMGPQGKLGREWYGDNPHAQSTLASKT